MQLIIPTTGMIPKGILLEIHIVNTCTTPNIVVIASIMI